MRYYALACDYDGTIAHHGTVAPETIAALERFRNAGGRVILVTGRQLDDLRAVFPRLEAFDRVVAEDGALLYRPETREEIPLGDPPPPEFLEELTRRGVEFSTGKVIVATWEPHSHAVLDLIREMGLEHHVIFNKGAVMVLPSGLNKAYGLRAALKELGLSRHNVVGVGDAENDHAFLTICECAVAVANALPSLQKTADLVTERPHGEGVTELVGRMLQTDLAELKLERHSVLVGRNEREEAVHVPSYGENLLLAGTSGGGKSTVAASFMERLAEQDYQYCIIDPDGDYAEYEGAIAVGSRERPPSLHEVTGLLQHEGNGAVNLLGVPMEDRPQFFENLFHAILDLRMNTGRPHWLIIDESHHLFPASRPVWTKSVPPGLQGLLLITVHPEHVAQQFLSLIDTLITLGEDPRGTITSFARAMHRAVPEIPDGPLAQGEAIAWRVRTGEPFRLKTLPPRGEHRRHLRKYAEGELPPERSFWFRGPRNILNLRAQNLSLFLQIGEGVDDKTWLHHFRQRDYSRWFREMIKDRKLAEEVEALEGRPIPASEGRRIIRRIVEEHYTGGA